MVIFWGSFRKVIHNNTNQVYAKCFIADSVSLRYADYSDWCWNVFLCFSHYTVVCTVCIKHHSCTWLVINFCLIPHIYIILHNILLLICSISYLLFLLWIYGTLNNKLLLCLNCVPINFSFSHCKTGILSSDIAVCKIM